MVIPVFFADHHTSTNKVIPVVIPVFLHTLSLAKYMSSLWSSLCFSHTTTLSLTKGHPCVFFLVIPVLLHTFTYKSTCHPCGHPCVFLYHHTFTNKRSSLCFSLSSLCCYTQPLTKHTHQPFLSQKRKKHNTNFLFYFTTTFENTIRSNHCIASTTTATFNLVVSSTPLHSAPLYSFGLPIPNTQLRLFYHHSFYCQQLLGTTAFVSALPLPLILYFHHINQYSGH